MFYTYSCELICFSSITPLNSGLEGEFCPSMETLQFWEHFVPGGLSVSHWRIQTPQQRGQPSLPHSLSLLLEVGPLNTAWTSLLEERCKLPYRGLGQSPSGNRIWGILALKSDIWWHKFYWFSWESIDHSVCHSRIGEGWGAWPDWPSPLDPPLLFCRFTNVSPVCQFTSGHFTLNAGCYTSAHQAFNEKHLCLTSTWANCP